MHSRLRAWQFSSSARILWAICSQLRASQVFSSGPSCCWFRFNFGYRTFWGVIHVRNRVALSGSVCLFGPQLDCLGFVERRRMTIHIVSMLVCPTMVSSYCFWMNTVVFHFCLICHFLGCHMDCSMELETRDPALCRPSDADCFPHVAPIPSPRLAQLDDNIKLDHFTHP